MDGDDYHPPVIDPTKNVLALVEAAQKRQDDLLNARMEAVTRQMETHIAYARQLAEAESKRIDAIRAVDVSAVATAQEKATQQAAVLATQVVASAETLRALVASTATANADRLALLEKSQYETKGRSGMSTPLLLALATLGGGSIVWAVEQLLRK